MVALTQPLLISQSFVRPTPVRLVRLGPSGSRMVATFLAKMNCGPLEGHWLAQHRVRTLAAGMGNMSCSEVPGSRNTQTPQQCFVAEQPAQIGRRQDAG